MSTALAPRAAPEGLVPGDPAGARALATRLDAYADSAATAAGQLRALDAGGWVGEAAEAFRQALGQVPERLERAVGAFAEAASALRSYASTLEEPSSGPAWPWPGWRQPRPTPPPGGAASPPTTPPPPRACWSRPGRGVTGQTALSAYRTGSHFFDTRHKNYVRFHRQTGVAVVLKDRIDGPALSVLVNHNRRPHPSWVPIRHRRE